MDKKLRDIRANLRSKKVEETLESLALLDKSVIKTSEWKKMTENCFLNALHLLIVLLIFLKCITGLNSIASLICIAVFRYLSILV